jgi:phosphoglycerol transferase MdoB-like AlkP superfamily enzyme
MTTSKIARNRFSKRYFWFLFPISIVFYELIIKISIFGFSFDDGLLYTLLFSVSIGLLMTAVCTLFKPKIGNILAIIGLIILLLIYGSQFVYHQIFNKFYIISSISGAGAAIAGFTNSTIKGIFDSLIFIIIFLIPGAVYLIFRKNKLKPRKTKLKSTLILIATSVILYFFTIILILLSSGGAPSSNDLYFHTFSIDHSVRRFGLLTSSRLDLQHLVFPYSDSSEGNDIVEIPDVITVPVQQQEPEETDVEQNTEQEQAPVEEAPHEEEFVPVDNVMIIDFETLLNTETDSEYDAMNKYFSSLTPTKTNKYTGMFKGKNLIFMTCEALSKYAIRPDTTPTLYKMMTEGFYFTNFYNPSWTVSTSDGEYVACTGLIPKEGVWSFYRSGLQKNLMAFCMGNTLRAQGYRTLAYHNNTYTYYNRDYSHPNMGYIYKGYGNGLNVKKTWPESDLEMMELSYEEYMYNRPFHAYYMTVSGHMEYTWPDNAMSSKHRSEVADLPYSEIVKGYLACNIELDKACEFLLNKLNELGIAEDTVIIMSPDHIPYGLTYEEYDELAGRHLDPNTEYYESVCIIYCQGMEPTVVDKITCSLDILPTIHNLFGLDYDSRLLMGYDMLSTAPSLVVFDNYSWLTDAGYYNAKKREFIANEGVEVDSSYVSTMNKVVANKFKYSTKILDKDYYGYLQKKLNLWPAYNK